MEDAKTVTDAHGVLAAVWRAGSMGRRLVRQSLGRWLDGQLITGPDAELRATLIEQLGRQGWQIRHRDSVLVAAKLSTDAGLWYCGSGYAGIVVSR